MDNNGEQLYLKLTIVRHCRGSMSERGWSRDGGESEEEEESMRERHRREEKELRGKRRALNQSLVAARLAVFSP